MARMYGSGLREHALIHMDTLNFADIEARMLAHYAGHDPRNHFGKFANRRFN